jgi:glycosyltransferase involved in cell wall biosynthesis
MGQFARMLPDVGWDVSVLTGRHDGGLDLAALDPRTRIVTAWSPLAKLAPRGQSAPRHGAMATAKNVVKRVAHTLVFPDREVVWIPSAIAAGRRLLASERHDVVLATHGPASNLVVGRALAKLFDLPLVVDFRDLWSTLPMPIFPTAFHRKAARALEGTAVRAATKIVAVAPRMASEIATTHGRDEADAVSITNGFDPADLVRARDTRPTTERPFRLVYTGSVNVHYNLDPFWQAIKALADEGRITPETLRIEFVGNLALSDVRAHGVAEFVEARGYVPHDQVFAALGNADALFLIETRGYYAEYSYVAKLFDYLLTGKPVLALVEQGNTFKLLRDAGVGCCADPSDAPGVRRAIEAVLALKGAPARSVDVDAEPLSSFNRRHLVTRLASVLDEAVRLEPHGHW